MAEKLTPQQQLAVENRGGKLLVSAAAGSGKTKVLVDRLLSYLTDPDDPANVDDFLIITYTKAAAAELRGKIAAKLSERLAQDPGNKHLQRQLQRLYLAKISTVHAFCGDLLRDYAYRLDLPADFRVAEENECFQLQLSAMEAVLDEAYRNMDDDPDFRAFVDTQGLGRDDRMIPNIVLQVYQSARCHLDMEKWLDMCVERMDVSGLSDASQTAWGRFLMEDLQHYLDLQIEALSRCAKAAAVSIDMDKPAALLSDTVVQLKVLRSSKTWDDIIANKHIDYGRLTFSKKCTDTELADRIKAVRDNCKTGLTKKLRSFSDSSAQVLYDINDSAAAVRGLVAFTRKFADAYDRLKRGRRILDFGDLEHKTLDLLLGKGRKIPTAIAGEVGMRFREIMVDEYQDSNAVQDAIFSALTVKRQNCFMVGDVKQSIYQFRLADPGIFLDKYHAYGSAEHASVGQGRKVLLSANFRSSGGVISAVNDVFSSCMSPEVGGLEYTDEEMLIEGLPHAPIEDPEVSLCTVPVSSDTYAEEAAVVADRIVQLLDGTHMIRQDGALRPIQPEDIVILLRSPKSVGGEFCYALQKRGIRCSMGNSSDLLGSEEVSFLRCLLQVISNPLQDIPLVAVLLNRIFAFSADELAQLRSANRRSCVLDVLKQAKTAKAKEFLEVLNNLRKDARILHLSELLEKICALTHADSIYAAMPDGQQRSENMRQFLLIASDYETAVGGGLDRFLEYLNALDEKGIASTGDETLSGAVTVMSIHKSKGLEFPVVFLCGLSRGFNKESLNAQLLCDRDLGIGISCVDIKNRVRYPSVAKRAMSVKMMTESISEEMRVLYVAMTRARDRLIMTYAVKNPERDICDLVNRMDISPKQLLTADVDCPGTWVLLTALRRMEAGALFALGGRPDNVMIGEPAWDIQVETAPIIEIEEQDVPNEPRMISTADLDKLRRSLEFRYPYEAATKVPSKQTATQLKGRYKDQEISDDTPKSLLSVSFREPSFAKSDLQGKGFGTAVHEVMQYIRYESCTDISGVEQEITRLEHGGFISQDVAKQVDCGMIWDFFKSDMGAKVRAEKCVLREFKFSVLDDACNYADGVSDEKVLLQGVVDCAVIEDDGITIIDFKTDRVTDETLQKSVSAYKQQVSIYTDALSKIYQLPVKNALLYFFRLSRFVQII